MGARRGIAIGAALLAFAATACGGGGHDVSSTELNLYTWTEYVPDSVIQGFQDKYGVTVNVTYYDSNEEAIRGIEDNPGTYDIVIPSDYAVQILIGRELLEEIDPNADLENFGNIDESFRAPFFDPGGTIRSDKGKEPEPKFSVPYQWGTTGIVYDSAQVSFTPATWADVARPEVQGRVALVDDARDVLGAGLIATGHDRNDASAGALADAQAWVESLDAVPVNAENPERPLVDGDAVIGIMYNGNAAEAMRANPDFRYVLPKDGSIWFDNLAIPLDAPHRDAALAFIDYVLEPDVGADITRFFGYSTPNDASLGILEDANDPSVDNAATNPPQDALLDLLLEKDVGPEGSARFEQTWEEIRP
jgi:spermidine/putrescine transport system substrate-binding protein